MVASKNFSPLLVGEGGFIGIVGGNWRLTVEPAPTWCLIQLSIVQQSYQKQI